MLCKSSDGCESGSGVKGVRVGGCRGRCRIGRSSTCGIDVKLRVVAFVGFKTSLSSCEARRDRRLDGLVMRKRDCRE